MNKLEQLHLDAIQHSFEYREFEKVKSFEINQSKAASKSTQITENISIEFAEWLIKRLPPKYDCDTTTNYIPQVMINEKDPQLWVKGHNYKMVFYTTKNLFAEFLKQRQ